MRPLLVICLAALALGCEGLPKAASPAPAGAPAGVGLPAPPAAPAAAATSGCGCAGPEVPGSPK